MVQTIKALLKKADDPLLALLAYRLMPWVQSSRAANVSQTAHHCTGGTRATVTKDARLWLTGKRDEDAAETHF